MTVRESVWAPQWRPLTVGLIVTITLVASEALAVATVLPLVSRDLHGVRLYGWVISAFFLGTMIGVVLAGEVTDRRGPAAPFAAGLTLFSAGLLVSGLAPAMWVVVLGRGLQGIGAGAVPAVAFASIGRTIPGTLRPRVFALLSTAWVLPGLLGPAAAAGVAAAAGWRAVFLGLLPLVAVASVVPYRALRRIGPPAEPIVAPTRIVPALRVAAGAGLALAALSERSPWSALLVVAAIVVAARPLRVLAPVGTWTARTGMPAAVLARGLLTFAFFGADTFVPLAIVAVRHRSTALAGLALTTATVSWTVAAWVQERLASRWSARRLVGLGFAIELAGIAGSALALLGTMPIAVAIVAWGIAGFGIGLAFAALSLAVLREAPPGQEGTASSALQLLDNLGVAFGAGLGGAAVAFGAAHGRERLGIAVAFAAAAVAALAGTAVAHRLTRGPLSA